MPIRKRPAPARGAPGNKVDRVSGSAPQRARPLGDGLRGRGMATGGRVDGPPPKQRGTVRDFTAGGASRVRPAEAPPPRQRDEDKPRRPRRMARGGRVKGGC